MVKIIMFNKLKRFCVSLTAFALTLTISTTTVFAAPSMNELNTEVEILEQETKELQEELTALQSQLTEIIQEMDNLERKIAKKGEEISNAEIELEAAEEKEKEQYENMKSRIAVMYENGNTTFLEILINAESFVDVLRKAEFIKQIYEYDRTMLDEYNATKNRIAELKSGLESDMAELQDMAQAYEVKQSSVDNLISLKQSELRTSQAELDVAVKAAAEEAARKAAEEAARKEAERKAREEAAKKVAEEEKKKQEQNNNSNKDNNTANKDNTSNNSNNNTDTINKGNQSVGNAIVAAARTQLGVPYVWGGTKPYKGLDCSGLTQYCHKTVGISIPRVSYDQAASGKKVNSLAEAKPGDIICYPGHVAIYIGNYRVIHAPHTGDVVKEATVYLKTITAIRRYW